MVYHFPFKFYNFSALSFHKLASHILVLVLLHSLPINITCSIVASHFLLCFTFLFTLASHFHDFCFTFLSNLYALNCLIPLNFLTILTSIINTISHRYLSAVYLHFLRQVSNGKPLS